MIMRERSVRRWQKERRNYSSPFTHIEESLLLFYVEFPPTRISEIGSDSVKQRQPGMIVFSSYALDDRAFHERLMRHLSQLRRDGLIEVWYQDRIPAGTNRKHTRNRVLHAATIILLLISANFLASDRCYQEEMYPALKRSQRGEAQVIPIIVRPCDWKASPLRNLQCLPRNGTPITSWNDLDEALNEIVQELRKIVEERYTY